MKDKLKNMNEFKLAILFILIFGFIYVFATIPLLGGTILYIMTILLLSFIGVGVPIIFAFVFIKDKKDYKHIEKQKISKAEKKNKRNVNINKHVDTKKSIIIGSIALLFILLIIIYSDIAAIPYYLDIPNMVTCNYKVTCGVVTKEEYASKGIGYKSIHIGENTYSIANFKTYDNKAVVEGDRVIIWYLPHTELIRKIKLFNGKATQIGNDYKYEGYFKDGKYDGKGTIIYKGGEKYIGKWHKGLLDDMWK